MPAQTAEVRHIIERDAAAREVGLAFRPCNVEALSPDPISLLKVAATLPLFVIFDVNWWDLDLFIVGKR
jgi:hypothetical protein